MAQSSLPGTVPAPPLARKNHKAAVAVEREAQRAVDNLRESLADAHKALKKATEERRRTEDDLNAAEANERR